MKKIVSIIVSLLIGFILCGCGTGNNGENGGGESVSNMDNRFKGQPEYEDDREMLISGYWSPRPVDELWADVKEAGFTHMYLEGKYGAHGSENYLKALTLAEKYDIKIIAQRYSEADGFEADPTDYSKYPAFDGFNIWDEPGKNHFAVIANDVETFNRLYGDTDKVFYSNLYPHYATGTQTGYPSFAEYVDAYCRQVIKNVKNKKVLSCDSYPLMREAARDKNFLLSGHLSSVNTIARAAKRYGAEPYFFIQSMSYGDRRAPLLADFCLQANTCFAFGIRGIQHFTYMTPNNAPGGEFNYDQDGNLQTALLDRENQKTERWAYAKELNRQIAFFDHVYLNFSWDGVMTTEGTASEEHTDDFGALASVLKKHARVKFFRATEDTLLGCFTDEKGYQGFMVTPYLETTLNRTTTVTLQFEQADKALIYTRGTSSVTELKDGKLTLEIAPGDGVFVIPYVA